VGIYTCQFIFWLVFFALCRSLFLIWNIEEIGESRTGETLSAFYQGLRLDAATAAYFMAACLLLFIVAGFWQTKRMLQINNGIQFLFILIVSIITVAELPIYDEWHHKLTYKAIWFLRNPSEVILTAGTKQLLLGLLSIGILIFTGWQLFRQFVPRRIELMIQTWPKQLAFGLISPVVLFWFIRGGFMQQIPIQVSDAYYSSSNFLNMVSVNSSFHLFSNWVQNAYAGEPYHFLPETESQKILGELYRVEKDTTVSVLTTQRPNIVLVVLEGWSADLIASLGGYKDITPYMDTLIQQGISFDSCYASGSLSDQGMAAVFSAFPAQPKTSIITQPDKYTSLPCLSKIFKKEKYYTSFLFGGELSYGNIRAYAYYNQFDRILEGKDFPASFPRGKLGVHDEFLFERQLQELETTPQPFFASLFTLSSHGPYDMPMPEKLHWGDKEKPYINSVHYADQCIKRFIESARKKSWYANTLFVFVPDHSHNSPRNWSFNEPNYRRIPMIWYGDVIRQEYRGHNYSRIASQLDLASTLLHQLNMDAKPFSYSKNLFNPYSQNFAAYAYDEGFGWMRSGGYVVYAVRENRYDHQTKMDTTLRDQLTKEGKAYLQQLSNDYHNFR
jgi:phosphoglycerol transferase MdoB-like AlkP superfamily enzyme